MNKRTDNNAPPSIIELDETSHGEITVDDINRAACSAYFYALMQKRFPSDLHSRMMVNLTHQPTTEEEAKTLWQAITSHLHHLNKTLKRNVGIAVAAMDYFTNLNTTVIHPILIDEQTSSSIVSTTTTDALTGLYCREFFDGTLQKEVEAFHRGNHSLCLMMIDIDDFKQVNDDFGHQIGDKALTSIGEIINTCVRKADIASRYGGEELAVIMPDCNILDAKKVATRICSQIANASIIDERKISVSIGVSEMKPPVNTARQLIHNADIALYQAKEDGKNRVCLSTAY